MKYMKLFAVMLVAALMVVAGCEKKAGTDATGAPADTDGDPGTTNESQDDESAPDAKAPDDAETAEGNDAPTDG